MKTPDLLKIKKQLRDLSARTIANGFTEAEAMQALDFINAISTKYNIGMDEIHLKDETHIQKVFISNKKILTPAGEILSGIGRYCDVKVWYQVVNGKMTYFFFGFETDVEMAVYLTGVLEAAIDWERKLFAKTPAYLNARNRNSTQISFKTGMVHRIYSRLTMMRNEMDEKLKTEAERRTQETGKESRSLTIVKKDMVLAAFAELGLKLRTVKRNNVVRDGSAYGQGKAAGDKVNLNRPLTGKGATSDQLKLSSR